MAFPVQCENPAADMESDSIFAMLPEVKTNNWEYRMRRDMQEVVPGLFIGPYCSATGAKLETLQSTGITHIICVRCPLEARIVRPKFPDLFKYLVLDINDAPTENIIKHFPLVRDFVNESLRTGGKTLIHGNAGISRSAALVLAYVMEKYGITFKEAYSFLQSRRFCINPNEGFTQQLQEFEPIYHARLTVQNRESSSNPCFRHKRGIDDVEHGTGTEYMET